jgi:glutamate dehydrogenase/leucine dehydrogenase
MSILATALEHLCRVAERLLRERGVFFVPDILTNAGGVVVL